MIIPKKNRIAIYSYLFKEGVIVAKKDPNAPKHLELEVPNLHVLKLLQSLKSRQYVTEQFNWQHFYWYLTNEGIEFLRGFLHLPDEIVPATLKKPKAAPRISGGAPQRGYGAEGERGPRPPRFGAEGGEKKVGPGAEFQPGFRGEGRGGFGRGGPRGGGEGGRGGYSRGGGDRSGYRREGGAPGSERPSFGRGAPRP